MGVLELQRADDAGEHAVFVATPEGMVCCDPAPQTERALKVCPQQAIWHAADDKEISTLQGMHVLKEVVFPNEAELKAYLRRRNTRVWPTKFVRKWKVDPITSKRDARSRLVCQGQHHREGREYERKDNPTPMFSTILLVLAIGTVLGAHDFQFDLKQFHQQTECVTPDGELYLLPPPRYQHSATGEVALWQAVKWLQGAKGAARAARDKLVAVLASSPDVPCFPSSWDSCLFIHESARGRLVFALHVDDGVGGWTTNAQLAVDLKKLLEVNYGTIKWGKWGNTLGFATARSADGKTTTITAENHIEALRDLVKDDCSFAPATPYTSDIMALQAVEAGDEGSPEHAALVQRAEWMRSACGHVQHIVKVRPDAAAACNMAARYAHAPCEKAVRCMKYVIFYLLSTPKLGLVFGGVEGASAADLEWRHKPSHTTQLDVGAPSLAYFVVCDGDLRADRSVSGIVHRFAGAAISVQSVRQHSIAIDAHSSECFTASTAACQAIAFRGLLTELRISQELPTPIYSDSRSTLLVAQNAAALRKSIYILRRVLYMREAVAEGEVDFFSCAGGTNPADPLTKYVRKKVFVEARRFWMGA